MTKEKPAEESVFKYDVGQTCRFIYNTSVMFFIVHQEFDAKSAEKFYYGRVFRIGQVDKDFIKVSEIEIEGILTPEQEEQIDKQFPTDDGNSKGTDLVG